MFSDNMDKNWKPRQSDKPVDVSLHYFIMTLPMNDRRYKEYFELLDRIEKLESKVT